MDNERNLDFDEMMLIKEKRRSSMSRGKKTYEKDRISKKAQKAKKPKNIVYDPNLDEDNLDVYYL